MSTDDVEAKQGDADAADHSFLSLAHEAVHLTMTNRFNDADAFIAAHQADDVRVEEVGSLLAYLAAISSHADHLLDSALKSIWATEAHARKQLSGGKQAAQRIEGELIQADSYMLGALTQLVQQAYMKMAWNVRKSYGFYHSAEKRIQEEEDRAAEGRGTVEADKLAELKGWMQFGVGLFNIILSLLPPTVMTVAEWIGYAGDRDKAFTYLRASQESPSFMAPFACLLLLTYYLTVSTFIGQDDPAFHVEAKKLLDVNTTRNNPAQCRIELSNDGRLRLTHRPCLSWAKIHYPNGAFFLLMESRYWRVKADPKQAIEVAQAGLKVIKEMPSVAVMYQYQCGWCGLFALEWLQCGRYFDSLLHSKLGGDYVVPADSPRHLQVEADDADVIIPPTRASAQSLYAYLCGIAYGMAGDTHRAEWYLRSVPAWLTPQQKPIDLYAVRRAHQVLSREPRMRREELTLDVMELIICWNGLVQLPPASIAQLRQLLAAAQPLTDPAQPHPLSRDDAVRYEWAVAALDGLTDPRAARTRVGRVLDAHGGWLRDGSEEVRRSGLLTLLYYSMADTSVELKEWDEAKQWLGKANAQKNYDLYSALQLKLHALGQRIKREEDT